MPGYISTPVANMTGLGKFLANGKYWLFIGYFTFYLLISKLHRISHAHCMTNDMTETETESGSG